MDVIGNMIAHMDVTRHTDGYILIFYFIEMLIIYVSDLVYALQVLVYILVLLQ